MRDAMKTEDFPPVRELGQAHGGWNQRIEHLQRLLRDLRSGRLVGCCTENRLVATLVDQHLEWATVELDALLRCHPKRMGLAVSQSRGQHDVELDTEGRIIGCGQNVRLDRERSRSFEGEKRRTSIARWTIIVSDGRSIEDRRAT